MKPFLASAAVLSCLSLAPVQVLAQPPAPMPGMAMPAPGTTPMNTGPMSTGPMSTGPLKPGVTLAEGSMMSAMDKMSKDMAAVPMTGDADRDFVGMMLPHHQGAIDMAKFELAHGKDPAIRRLARAIVAAQDKEMAEMRAWQAKRPGPH